MSASKFGTYDQIGQAEDVSDMISMIAPTKVPFQTSIRDLRTKAKTYQWQEDDLAAVADNAAVEGADAPAASQTATTMRSNVTQILTKSVKVTGSAQAVDTYGRDDELAYQLTKKGKEIKRDLEYALVGKVQAAVTGDDSTARKMASAFSQIDSSVTNSNSGTPRALTETILLDVMKKVFDANGDANTLMIKPADATVVANFAYRTQGATYGMDRSRDVGSGTTIVNVVDFYRDPWSDDGVRVKMNRFMKTTEALVYDPSNWSLRWLRKWQRKLLAVTGDSEAHMMLGEVTLQHVNQKASGRITDLS